MKKLLPILLILGVLACRKTSTPDPANKANSNDGSKQPTIITNSSFASDTYSTVFIKKDGTLWTFGKGEFIGKEPAVTVLTPQQVGADKDWKSVTTGWATFALKTDWVQVSTKIGIDFQIYALKKEGTLWVSNGGLKAPYAFNQVDTHSSTDKYEAIYPNGSGIVAKRPGKDEYCSYGIHGSDATYILDYSGNILVTQRIEGTCASF